MNTKTKKATGAGTQVKNLSAATFAYAFVLLLIALLPLAGYLPFGGATTDPTVTALTKVQDAAARHPATVTLPAGIERTVKDEGTYLHGPGTDNPEVCWALLIPSDETATPTIAKDTTLCDNQTGD